VSWVLVSVGGAVGTLFRYGLARLGAHWFGGQWFPFGTFAANALGSMLLGLVYVLGEDHEIFGVDARLVLGTGMMGGFTTYSTFNLETIRLAADGAVGRAALYVALTLLVCLGAGAAGLALGRGLR